MEITEIKVRAGKTISNPHREFSNLRFDIELAARLVDLESPDAVVEALQDVLLEMLDEQEARMLGKEEQASIDRQADEFGTKCVTCGHVAPVHTWLETGYHGRCRVSGCRCEAFLVRPVVVTETPSGGKFYELAPAGVCRVCDCTEETPCIDAETGEGCYWTDATRTLCSRCRDEAARGKTHHDDHDEHNGGREDA